MIVSLLLPHCQWRETNPIGASASAALRSGQLAAAQQAVGDTCEWGECVRGGGVGGG